MIFVSLCLRTYLEAMSLSQLPSLSKNEPHVFVYIRAKVKAPSLPDGYIQNQI